MNRVTTFSVRLKEYRTERQLTLENLSLLVGFPCQTLSRWERGDRVPKIDAVSQIAEQLNVSPLWLIGYDVDSNIHVSAPALSKTESYILDKFRVLDFRGQSSVLNILEHEYEAMRGGESANPVSKPSKSL